MKQAPSSSWSIRDVPLETRDQVSAAADREGLSVGDWLARNIIADSGFAAVRREPSRQNGADVSNSNSPRTHEALLSLARLLESHERAQEHASNTMQSVAAEIEAAVHSQASTLKRLNDRVQNVERQSGDVAQRGSDTAARLTSLAVDLEALAKKIASAHETSDRLGRLVQQQLGEISERLRAGEARAANYPQIERAVSTLSDSYVGASGRLQDLGAKLERLSVEFRAARETSERAFKSVQERLVSIDSRVRGTEARTAGYAELESAVHELNQSGAHAAGQIGALFSDVEKIGGEAVAARQETAKLGAAVREQLTAIAIRLQNAEERIAAQAGMDKTIEALNAQDNAIAGKIGALVTGFTKLQEDLQSTREESRQLSDALRERVAKADEETTAQIGTLTGNVKTLRVEMESLREHGITTGNADADLLGRIDALEDHARSAAVSLGQNEEAVRNLIERDRQHAEELGTVRDTLARFEHLLITAREEHRDALNRVDANLGEISAKLVKPEPLNQPTGVQLSLPAETAAVPAHDPAGDAEIPAAAEVTQQNEPAQDDQGSEARSAADSTIEDEIPHPVSHDLRTWLSAPALQPTAEGEFELPPHPVEPATDSVLELTHELPDVQPGEEAATSPVEGDYLTEARRAAREAHEQIARERGLHTNIQKMKDQAQSHILRPALLAVILLLLVSWMAVRFTHQAHPAMPGAPHVTKSKPVPVSHKQALASPKAMHAQAAPVTAQTSVAAGAPQSTQAAAAAATFTRVAALAQNGDRSAMLALGIAFDKGAGVAPDQKQATTWLQKAAEAGDAVAQFRLGVRLEKGAGAPKDPTEAVHWYKQAAALGNRSAMYNLGVALANGTGVAKDMNEAARLFRSAADLGLRDAQFNLAVLYEHGWGVNQSLADAYRWYCIAAANGDSQSGEHSEALATQITVAQKAAADRTVAAFKPQAVKPDANELPEMAKPFAS